jgi:hypothetical protein
MPLADGRCGEGGVGDADTGRGHQQGRQHRPHRPSDGRSTSAPGRRRHRGHPQLGRRQRGIRGQRGEWRQHHPDPARDQEKRGCQQGIGRPVNRDQETGEQRPDKIERFLGDAVHRVRPLLEGRTEREHPPGGPHGRTERRRREAGQADEDDQADRRVGGHRRGEGGGAEKRERRERTPLAEPIDQACLGRQQDRGDAEEGERESGRGVGPGRVEDGEQGGEREETVREPATERGHEGAQRERQPEDGTVLPARAARGMGGLRSK